MQYGTIWQPRFWIRNKNTNFKWLLVYDGPLCLSEERATELLNEIKETPWWIEECDGDPMKKDDTDVHMGVVDRRLEYL